jgi:hypothetical protein
MIRNHVGGAEIVGSVSDSSTLARAREKPEKLVLFYRNKSTGLSTDDTSPNTRRKREELRCAGAYS